MLFEREFVEFKADIVVTSSGTPTTCKIPIPGTVDNT